MIKNTKYDNTMGGRIVNFDFKQANKNKDGVPKNTLFFNLTLNDNTVKTFKISQHTFAHFDEFSNLDLKGQITKFTDIIQFFVVFIFLLNSMRLTSDDFKNMINCNTQKLKDTCKIQKKKCLYNTKYINLTIYIDNYNDSHGEIFITSLFQNNYGKDEPFNNNINNIQLTNNNNKQIKFTDKTINKLLGEQTNIIANNYDINYILNLLKDDYDGSTSQKSSSLPVSSSISSVSSVSPSPSKATNVKIYKFSIPKVSGGKKHKLKSSKKRQNKGRYRKTRKK